MRDDNLDDNLWVDRERHEKLLALEKSAQELVDAMEKLPDASAQLLGLKALLKPAEPVYVPLVGQRELELIASQSTHHIDDMKDAIVMALREAADRIDAKGNNDILTNWAIRDLREWADQEEKYNA